MAESDRTQSLARILADIAHDVRGVAGGTDLWIELLSRGGDEAARARATAELRRGVERGVRLAEDLGDAAGGLEGAADGEAMPFDLAAALADSCRRLAAEAAARRVELAPVVPPGFRHALVGDPSAWGRTLDRVLAAAVRQAPAGTVLEAHLAVRPPGAELKVACGALRLPPEGPLLEAWGAARPAGESFPLGLALARSFLARAGGRLEVGEGAGGRELVVVTP